MDKTKILTLNDRSELFINDVKTVESFDEFGAVLLTERGVLNVEGSNIHISNLDTSGGVVEITGKIDSIVYSDNSAQKKKGLRERLFG